MPLIARMSCGAGLPSTMKSPFSTMSPSCRWMCLPFGIRYSRISSFLSIGSIATRQLEDLAILALDDDRRTQIRSAARRAPVDDDALGDTGGFVERLRDRLSLDQVLEPDGALDFGQNRPGVGIPFGDALAALDH